jgi:hypothetical protein
MIFSGSTETFGCASAVLTGTEVTDVASWFGSSLSAFVNVSLWVRVPIVSPSAHRGKAVVGKRSRITSDADDLAACGTSAFAEENMPIFTAKVAPRPIKQNTASQTVLIASSAHSAELRTEHELRRLGELSTEMSTLSPVFFAQCAQRCIRDNPILERFLLRTCKLFGVVRGVPVFAQAEMDRL